MKTKTTIICLLLFTSISLSQNLQVFDSFEDFQTAVTNNCSTTELTFEGFDNIISNICSVPTIPDPNQTCFASDELQLGFSISGLSQSESMGAFVEGAFVDNPINIVFPNNSSDTTLIDFSSGVNAVSFATYSINDIPIEWYLQVYGEDNKFLGPIRRDIMGKALHTFNVICDEPITRIESIAFQPTGQSFAGLNVGALYFGASNCTTPITIPDTSFEQLLVDLGYDDIIDGAVLKENIETVTALDISSQNISNLKGIEAFTALEIFTSVNNPLTAIDLSNNQNLSQVIVNNNQQLTNLNLQNGFNNRSLNSTMVLSTLDATNNLSLQCIQVDNVSLAENNSNWQKDALAVYSEDCEATLSISSNDISSLISVYPNPVKDVLTVDYSKTINSIEVYNLQGQKLFKKEEQNRVVHMGELASGIYFLKINTDYGYGIKKIVKE